MNELTDTYVLFRTANSTFAEKLSLRSNTSSTEVPLKNFTYTWIVSETVSSQHSLRSIILATSNLSMKIEARQGNLSKFLSGISRIFTVMSRLINP